MNILNEKFWAKDKNGVKCFVGDKIKDCYGNIGEIIMSKCFDKPFLKVKFDFGEVPLIDVFYDNLVEKI